MTRTIRPLCQSGRRPRQLHRKRWISHLSSNLIVAAPRQKNREGIAIRHKSAGGQTGGRTDQILFSDADVEEPVWKRLAKQNRPRGVIKVRVEHYDIAALL